MFEDEFSSPLIVGSLKKNSIRLDTERLLTKTRETEDATSLETDVMKAENTVTRRCGKSKVPRASERVAQEDGNLASSHFKNLTIEELVNRAKTLPPGLELYDVCRAPRTLISPQERALMDKKMRLSDTGLTEDLSCPICMGTCQNVAVVKDCLHRFCEECIERWLRTGHQDCPKCRKRIPSRRSLRADPIFERIVCRLFPDVAKFEEMNDKTVAQVNHRRIGVPLSSLEDAGDPRSSKRHRRSALN